jgi:hypothetical protein
MERMPAFLAAWTSAGASPTNTELNGGRPMTTKALLSMTGEGFNSSFFSPQETDKKNGFNPNLPNSPSTRALDPFDTNANRKRDAF